MTESHQELTLREMKVLELIASGRSGTEIADDLCVSPYAVKSHARNISRKLGLKQPQRHCEKGKGTNSFLRN